MSVASDELRVASGELRVARDLVRVAELLEYPDAQLMSSNDDEGDLVQFFEEIARVTPEGMQELYTRTFDLNPVATLEVGWHLWGEQYERGRFLSDLRGLQESLHVDAGNELPDHLTVILRTLARMSDPAALATTIAPALRKISAPLDEQGNPYRHLVHAATALATRYSSLATSSQLPTGACA